MSPSYKEIEIIYDGECPVCSKYVTMTRLRKSVGNVTLTDARKDITRSEQMKNDGYNLDDGMIVIYEGNIYYGIEAVHMLALLSSSSGVFNRFNAFIFKNQKASKFIYPLLVILRKILLKILNKQKIFKN